MSQVDSGLIAADFSVAATQVKGTAESFQPPIKFVSGGCEKGQR
jgi:hypothetical protein